MTDYPMAKVFISYSRKDLNFVQGFAQTLMSNSVDVWWDLSSMQGGDDWTDAIPQAIESCDMVIVVLSPNSIQSDWVQKEYTYALNHKKRIIPILYQACEIPFALVNINYIDIQGTKYQKGMDDIMMLASAGPGDKGQVMQPAHEPTAPVQPEIRENAPSGIFTNIWVEHNIVWGMFMGMRIHVSAVVRGQMNTPCKAVVHFFGYNNQPLIDYNANPMFRTVDGYVSTGVDFIPMYPEATFPDLVMYIPYNELHLMPGVHQLVFRISFYDMTRNFFFAQSYPQPFMVTQQ
jgi:hypothetical protein